MGTAVAQVRNIRVSPRKLNLLAAMIRGKRVQSAIDDLTFSRKRISADVLKGLRSAIANAENNHAMDIDNLIVSEAYVGKSITMRRFHARAKGRGAPIDKPFSNLTITLTEKEA